MTAEQGRRLEADPKWRAFLNGKQMQWRHHDGVWSDASNIDAPHFVCRSDSIRVKPKPVERWLVIDSNGSEALFCDKTPAENLAKLSPDRRLVHLVEKAP